jgi:hypothetical protein
MEFQIGSTLLPIHQSSEKRTPSAGAGDNAYKTASVEDIHS